MVRERDNFTCQVCGRVSDHVNAHHIIERGVKATRLCLENGITLCFSCHKTGRQFSAHKTPDAFKRWFKKKFSLRWALISRLARRKRTEREAIEEFKQLMEASS